MTKQTSKTRSQRLLFEHSNAKDLGSEVPLNYPHRQLCSNQLCCSTPCTITITSATCTIYLRSLHNYLRSLHNHLRSLHNHLGFLRALLCFSLRFCAVCLCFGIFPL